MATAKETRNQAAQGLGCLGKAADDEPVFVLRGQDAIAPMLVNDWAALALKHGCPINKVNEAKALAQKMRDWQAFNVRKFPD